MHQLGFGDKLAKIISKLRALKAKHVRDVVSTPLALPMTHTYLKSPFLMLSEYSWVRGVNQRPNKEIQ